METQREKAKSWIPIFILCCFLILYVILRAHHLSLTFDEIVTYEIQKTFSLSDAGKTANTHLLNTYLISLSIYFFGASELALRLPNVLALLVYLFAAIKIVSILGPNLRLHTFILLVAMPFLIDFFSLARGYGLGLSFMLLSVYYFLRFATNNNVFTAMASLVIAMVSVLGNYTMLNYFFPLMPILILMILLHKNNAKSKALEILLIILLGGFFLFIISPILFELKNGGQLFFGGKTNIYFDTIYSIGKCFGYHMGYSKWAQGLFVACFFTSIIIAMAFMWRLIKKRALDPIGYLALLFLLSLIFVEIQNKVLATNYPVERAAILYYPLMILVMFCGINSLLENKTVYLNKIVVALFCLHFLFTLNLTHCYSWRDDSGTKKMMADLKALVHKKIKLGIAILNSPSVNFYREKQALDSINIELISDFWEYPFGIEEYNPCYYNADMYCNDTMFFDIKKIIRPDVDYYYLDNFFVEELRKANIITKTIKEYPFSRTTLIQIN